MPKRNLNENQGLIYDILTQVCNVGDDWETAKAIEEWVNDHFEVEGGDLHMDGPDDWWIEDAVLGWK